MKRDEAITKADQGIAALHHALGRGRSAELERYLEVMAKFHRYSFNNIMLILLENPEATHVAGFHKWKELGRTVKKGETGIGILAPMRYKTTDEDGEEACAIRGFKIVHVFDISQTEGEELPELATITGEPGQALARFKAYVEELGIELEYRPSLGGSRLGTSAGGVINLVEGLEPAVEFAVLAHEVGHENLHHGERRNETTKTVRETEAEAVAFVVCRAFGLDSTTRSADYIQLHRGNTDTLAESLQFIQRTAEKIIDGINAARPDTALPGSANESLPSPCEHTVQCCDAGGAIQGSWMTEDAGDRSRVICKYCGKFYGYRDDNADAVPESAAVSGTTEADEAAESVPLRTGRADFEERKATRIDRYHELAGKRSSEAVATHDHARRMASVIPFGQPILVGHHSEKRDRRHRERIHNTFGKAFELRAKAKYWENRADAAESSTAISSDDPTAIEQLREKLESLEAHQVMMKAVNKAWRTAGKPAPDDQAGWQKVASHPEVELSPEQVERLRVAYARLASWQPSSAPFPAYSLSNNNAEIRRLRERIAELEASANAQHIERDCGVCCYVEDPELNRVQLFFDGKPSEETRKVLKQNGFRFSRRDGNAWQRLLNAAGKHAAQYVISQIGKE